MFVIMGCGAQGGIQKGSGKDVGSRLSGTRLSMVRVASIPQHLLRKKSMSCIDQAARLAYKGCFSFLEALVINFAVAMLALMSKGGMPSSCSRASRAVQPGTPAIMRRASLWMPSIIVRTFLVPDPKNWLPYSDGMNSSYINTAQNIRSYAS